MSQPIPTILPENRRHRAAPRNSGGRFRVQLPKHASRILPQANLEQHHPKGVDVVFLSVALARVALSLGMPVDVELEVVQGSANRRVEIRPGKLEAVKEWLRVVVSCAVLFAEEDDVVAADALVDLAN